MPLSQKRMRVWQKSLRDTLSPGETFSPSHPDYDKLVVFLKRHPGRSFGKIKRIYADYGNSYDGGTRVKGLCWWVEEEDGKCIDVPQNACIAPKAYLRRKQKGSQRADVLKAMRVLVQNDIEEFRRSCFSMSSELVCPISGCLFPMEMSDVDHHEPDFNDLAETFFKTFPNLDLATTKHPHSEPVFDETQTQQIWEDFHQNHASLRVVSKKGHLQKTRSTSKSGHLPN